MGYYYIEEPSDYGRQDPLEALYMQQHRQARMVAEQRRQQQLQMQHRAELEHRYRAQAEYEHQRRFQHQQQQQLMRQAVMRQQAAEHQRRVQHQRAVEQNMLRQRHLQQQQAQQAARHHHAEQQWISYVPRFDHGGHHIGWAAKITTGKKPGVQARCGGRVQKFKNDKPKMDFAALLRIAAQAEEEEGSLFSDNGSNDDAAEGSDVTMEGSAKWRKQQEAALLAFEAKAPAHRRAEQAVAFKKYEQANRARKTDEASVGMGLGLGDDAETASQSSHGSDASDQLQHLDNKLDEITSQEMSIASLSKVEESLTQLLLAADTVAVTAEERVVRKAFVKRVQKQLDAIDTVRASDSESDAEPEAEVVTEAETEAEAGEAVTKAAETETVTVDTSVEAREHSEAVSQALIAAEAKSDDTLDEETALLIRAIDAEHDSAAQSAEDEEAELSGALAPEEGDSDHESYDLISDAEEAEPLLSHE